MKRTLQDCTAIKNLILLCGLLLITGSAWAEGSDGYFYYYYAKVTTKTATTSNGQGSVYASTTAASVASATASTSMATGQDPNNYGESTDAPSEAGQVTFYLYAKPADGYKFDGWSSSATRPDVFESTNPEWKTTFGASTTQGSQSTTNPGGTQNSGSTASSGKTQYYCSSTAEYTIYAYFSEKVMSFDVSFAQPSNGSIKVGGTTPSSWPYVVKTTTGELNTTLVATPASSYRFWGWYTLNSDGSKNYLSYDATYNASFNDATTVYAEFCPSANAIFDVAGLQFYDLKEANAKAVANGGGKIAVVQDGVVPAGNYTIASGVTLLVPFEESNSFNIEPQVNTSATPSRSVYRTLTLNNGVNITVNGNICVNAIMALKMGYNGSVLNKYGLINMKEGSHINLNNGSNCYVWGYIIGGGTITAESGATLHETFQFKHRGGSALSSITSSSNKRNYKVFPINQYYVQSIEVPITIKKGAAEKVYTGVHNADFAVSFDFIGTSGLFKLTGTNAYLIKKYDVNNDRQSYTLYGDATISSIYFGISGFGEESKDYVLPITNNMTLDIESGTTTIQYETAILPDVQINIASNATIIASGNTYVYDSLNWKGAYAYANDYSAEEKAQIAPVLYRHGGLKYNRKNYKLRDAKIDVNGSLQGIIYTTNGGANIMSSGKGVITFTSVRNATTTYQVGQDKTTAKFDGYPITSAQLHNADGSYLATAGTAANTTIQYANGHWGWMEIWKDGEKILAAVNTIGKVNNASAKDALLPAAQDGYSVAWETTETTANQEVIHAVKRTKLEKYTITWKDMALKDPVIKTEDLYYGAQPACDYQKPSDENYDYEMLGWNVEGATSLEPIVIPTVTGNATYVALYNSKPKRIVVEEGEVLDVNYNNISMTVRVAGKLNVTASITTRDLILEATTSSSGEITNVENVKVDGKAYFDLKGPFKAKTWYAVAVPWQVEVPHNAPDYTITCGIYAKNSVGFAPLALGKDIDLIYYDGALRAEEGHSDDCWKYVEDAASNNEVMHPGKAYMFYLLNGTSELRFERKSGAPLNNTTASVEPHASRTGNKSDANWNGIANPATFKAYMNTASSNKAQVYVPDEKRYKLITDMEQTQLIVGQPIFVQATEPKTVVAYADNTGYASHAPRRAKATEQDGMKCEVRIAVPGKAYTDRLFVQTAEGKADEYIIGEDLAKAGVSDRVAQMWVDRYDARLCVNTVAPANNRAEYPLGISVPATGDYTITLANEGAEAEGIHVYLTLDGKPIWNLTYADYTATLEKGTTGRYGLRLVRNAPQIATGIDEAVVDAEGNTRKVLINNHVFIIRGEKVYTVDGQLVK